MFKALADPTRRALLDRLRERNGQTLGELCEPLEMARQSATQHLGLLEAANLITTIRRGREKLHYLNPVPLWDIAERWIERFERPRLRAVQRDAVAIPRHVLAAGSAPPDRILLRGAGSAGLLCILAQHRAILLRSPVRRVTDAGCSSGSFTSARAGRRRRARSGERLRPS